MADSAAQGGSIRRLGERVEARLGRSLGHDQQTVWRMLTDPEKLALWLAPGTIELRPGGRARLDFSDSGRVIDSAVSRCEPPRLLEYSWSQGSEAMRPLRWEITPTPEGARLRLTVTLPADDDAAKACGGFDAHLEMLAAALEGIPIAFPVSYYLERRRAWQSMLAA